MTSSTLTVIRYGYLNTASSRGPVTRVELDPTDIQSIRVWHDGMGNPNVTYALADGTVLFEQSAYGYLNDTVRDTKVIYVDRRKDLFPAWVKDENGKLAPLF